ncbi:hypothetical protein [Lysinibacillus sphaericus]|uniref:hypothetical protein n=1 Tax=Lysinibacillus sphaericus TaxID=1421 RepID=UPI0012D2B6D1|nr:hypothetical protein [Lysinibacillus sphaericus]
MSEAAHRTLAERKSPPSPFKIAFSAVDIALFQQHEKMLSSESRGQHFLVYNFYPFIAYVS